VLLWGSTLRRRSIPANKTYTLSRDEIVERVRFKSFQQEQEAVIAIPTGDILEGSLK